MTFLHTRFNRRDWLQRSALLALAPTIPAFLRPGLIPAALAHSSSDDNRILVVIQMSGGNDGFNTLVPYRDEHYQKLRPRLRVKKEDQLVVNDELALHNSMQGMHQLLEEGKLAIVQGVGYPQPNRSHEVSMAVWHTAHTDPEDHGGSGWLGRLLDSEPSSPSSPSSLLAGRANAPQALKGRRSTPATLSSFDEFGTAEEFAAAQNEAGVAIAEQASASQSLQSFMQRSLLDAYATSERMHELSQQSKARNDLKLNQVRGQLATDLRLIHQLIDADFGPSVYYAIQPGYDTHNNQEQTHRGLLRNLSDAVHAFLQDLRTTGQSQRVALLCFSEFGRQLAENASFGTDHGTAGVTFVAGESVNAGVYGTHPDLSQLKQNAPDFTCDFRQVYAALLRDWLRKDPQSVIGPHQPLAGLFR